MRAAAQKSGGLRIRLERRSRGGNLALDLEGTFESDSRKEAGEEPSLQAPTDRVRE